MRGNRPNNFRGLSENTMQTYFYNLKIFIKPFYEILTAYHLKADCRT